MPRIVPNLWFDTQALDAAEHYVSIFPNSKITSVAHFGEAGPREAGMVVSVGFELDGHPFTAINGGPEFTFDEAVSFMVDCADQDEVDRYWELLGAGGEESQCGWMKDRFGLSWQIVRAEMGEIMSDPDPDRAQRAMRAMLAMTKLDVAGLRAAADGTEG